MEQCSQKSQKIMGIYTFHWFLEGLPLPYIRVFEELNELCPFNLLSLASVHHLLLHTLRRFPSLFLHGHHTVLEFTLS